MNVFKTNNLWLVLTLCGLNLFVMHYSALFTGCVDGEMNITTIVDNIVGVGSDVIILFLLAYGITMKRLRPALVITFCITLLWSFSNVMYSRFFHSYVSLSAMGQGQTLSNPDIMRCVIDGFRSSDVYYILSTIFFWTLVKDVHPVRKPLAKLTVTLCLMVLVDVLSYGMYCSATPETRHTGFVVQRIYHRQLSENHYMCNPTNAAFRRGSLRTLACEAIGSMGGSMNLSNDQTTQIDAEIRSSVLRTDTLRHGLATRNVILVIVESYMSFTSDLKVDGREVTPFLNTLKRDSTVYYNGRMHENVTIGESSDGQFIYMTGLLPLRSVITVSKARSCTLPGLATALNRESRMVIPTVSSMWNQDEMCRQYGFDHLFASNDFADGSHSSLNDEQVFQLAAQKDKEANQPFFSVVLTMSMHQPYTQQIDSTFIIHDADMDSERACYLNVCHYTDRQIEKYFEYIKQTGLYDNSLIVIAADHPVHNTDFGGVSKDIPLYIANLPIKIRNRMWQGECNQVDVYTTLLDLMDIETTWYGLGHSLLSLDYSYKIDARKWDVSEWIVRGDYFSKNK